MKASHFIFSCQLAIACQEKIKWDAFTLQCKNFYAMPLNVSVPAPYISSRRRSRTGSVRSVFRSPCPQWHRSDNARPHRVWTAKLQKPEPMPAHRFHADSFYRSQLPMQKKQMHDRKGMTSPAVLRSGTAILLPLHKDGPVPHNSSAGSSSRRGNPIMPAEKGQTFR